MELNDKKGIHKENDAFCPVYNSNESIRIIWIMVLFIILWSVLLYFYPPEVIVEMLGVHNIYLLVFLLAAIGGVSTFTSTTFYTTLITIALGGVNALWVALFASIGLTLGDMLFYYLGTRSKGCVRGRYGHYVGKLIVQFDRFGDNIVMMLIFLYSLTPLPSDILAIALAIVEFPFRKMVAPLLIGNFALIVLLIELSRLGYSLI